MRLQGTRRIARDRVEVFDYTADFSHLEDWDPGVEASRRLGEGPVQSGSRFEVKAKFGTATLPMIYEISLYEPPERVVLIGRSERLVAVDDIKFRDEEGLTVVDYSADLTFLGALKFVAPLMAPVLRRIGTRALDGLVSALSR